MSWFSSYVIVFEFFFKVKEKKNRRPYLLIDPRVCIYIYIYIYISNIIRVIKSRRLRWAGHVARME